MPKHHGGNGFSLLNSYFAFKFYGGNEHSIMVFFSKSFLVVLGYSPTYHDPLFCCINICYIPQNYTWTPKVTSEENIMTDTKNNEAKKTKHVHKATHAKKFPAQIS